MSVPILVCGMHRSGTSAVAGLLHMNGVSMGRKDKFYPPPLPENPKGFFEDVRARVLNDAILAHNGYDVKSFSLDIPAELKFLPDHLRLMREFLQTRSDEARRKPWGFKDPRLCLTLEVWRRALPRSARILCIRRHTDAVVQSLARRNNLSEERARKLIRTYHFHLYNAARKMERFIVDYDSLMEGDEVHLKQLGEFVGRKLTDTSFLDPSLNHYGRRRANG